MCKQFQFLVKHQLLAGLLVSMVFTLMSCASAQRQVVKGDLYEIEFPDSLKEKDSIVDVVIEPAILDSLELFYPTNKKDTYQIAYLLPFYAKAYPEVSSTTKYISETAMRYWWGSLIAIDTLENIGLNAKVVAIDTENDSSKLGRIESRLRRDSFDLVMGPLFERNFAQLSQYSQETKTNMVSPISNNDQCATKHEYLLYSSVRSEFILTAQAQHVLSNSKPQFPIYVFHRNTKKESAEADTLIKLLSQDPKRTVVRKVVSGDFLMRDSYQSKFKDTCVVFILSDKEPFVSSVLTEMTRSQKSFNVIGREKWLEYESLNAQSWEKMGMVFFTTFHFDFENELTKRFTLLYREKYKEDPNMYAYLGYSQTMFYLTHLYYFGTNFQSEFGVLKYKLPCIDFQMAQSEKCKSFHNQHFYLFHFKDNELVEYTPTKNSNKGNTVEDGN